MEKSALKLLHENREQIGNCHRIPVGAPGMYWQQAYYCACPFCQSCVQCLRALAHGDRAQGNRVLPPPQERLK